MPSSHRSRTDERAVCSCVMINIGYSWQRKRNYLGKFGPRVLTFQTSGPVPGTPWQREAGRGKGVGVSQYQPCAGHGSGVQGAVSVLDLTTAL